VARSTALRLMEARVMSGIVAQLDGAPTFQRHRRRSPSP
jgi:hypothetical protein